jgi:hypothetical protein
LEQESTAAEPVLAIFTRAAVRTRPAIDIFQATNIVFTQIRTSRRELAACPGHAPRRAARPLVDGGSAQVWLRAANSKCIAKFSGPNASEFQFWRAGGRIVLA